MVSIPTGLLLVFYWYTVSILLVYILLVFYWYNIMVSPLLLLNTYTDERVELFIIIIYKHVIG